MSQNKWFMNIFDFNFGFNFLESLTFLARNILHSHHISFWTHIFWSRTHPHNYFDFAPEVAKSIFVVAYPSGSLISHPVQVLVHRIFFFFNPVGVAQWGP